MASKTIVFGASFIGFSVGVIFVAALVRGADDANIVAGGGYEQPQIKQVQKPTVKETAAPTPNKNDSPSSCVDAKENILRAMKEGGSDKAEASAASMYTFCAVHKWPQKLTDCFANASDYVSMMPCLDFAAAAAKLVNMAGKPASTANRKALADYWSYSIGSEMGAVVSATGKRARILRVTQGACSESYLEAVIAVLVDIDKLKEDGFRGVECHDGDNAVAKRKL